MSHALYHSRSSKKIWGGETSDYLPIHQFMDQSKAHFPLNSHRCIFHSSFGIFLVEQFFGPTIKNSKNQDIPTRAIAEQHVLEDMSFIPTLSDWLQEMPVKPWMYKKSKKLSQNPNLQ